MSARIAEVGSGEEGSLAEIMVRRVPNAVPGLAVACIRDGEITSVATRGLASVISEAPMTSRTVNHWFSMTKLVTATAVMQLVDSERIALGDPVVRYLPQISASRSGAPMAVRDLLSHTSGLANPFPLRWVHPVTDGEFDAREFAADLLARHGKPARGAGGRVRYSNLGYVALGELISCVSGQRYEDYVREHILDPLGMTRTDFAYHGALSDDVSAGHHPRLHPLEPVLRCVLPRGIVGESRGRWMTFNRFGVNGAAYGGLVGSVEDAARFLAMHMSDGTLERTRILSRESVRSMRELSATGRRLDVGLGWFRRRRSASAAEPHVEHLGGGAGFWNVMRLYPRLHAGVVVMGNATSFDHEEIIRASVGI
jgi:CubicO group peptidase (beta-lactamase class C family)